MSDPLIERLAALALRLVVDPPSGDDPVVRFATPTDLVAAFEDSVGLAIGDEAPAHDPDDVVVAVRTVVDHSIRTNHPRFMNQNFAGADPVAVIGDWLAAALNTATTTFEIAPVFHLMEATLLAKLAHLAGYPVGSPGGTTPDPLPPGLFCPGGSMATLYALQLARHRLQPDLVRVGAGPGPLAVFVSASGHYAVGKSAALLGIGTDAVVAVEVDADGAMEPGALRTAVRVALDTGRSPLAVVATAGTTVTCAFDPLDEVADVCADLAALGVPRVLSIAAGVRTGAMEAVLGDDVPVVRVMPNTPSLVGEGAAAVAGGKAVTEDDLAWASGILSAVGKVVVVREDLLDAVTGLSGSGPAYVFLLAEALMDAGEAEGLPRHVAVALTEQTLLGAATLLRQSEEPASTLRENVTSKGGTTAAGLAVFEAGDFRSMVRDVVAAAAERSRQLGAG